MYTTFHGCSVENPMKYQRIGSGQLTLRPFHLIDLQVHFYWETIPE
jgi:hypothetical protein